MHTKRPRYFLLPFSHSIDPFLNCVILVELLKKKHIEEVHFRWSHKLSESGLFGCYFCSHRQVVEKALTHSSLTPEVDSSFVPFMWTRAVVRGHAHAEWGNSSGDLSQSHGGVLWHKGFCWHESDMFPIHRDLGHGKPSDSNPVLSSNHHKLLCSSSLWT